MPPDSHIVAPARDGRRLQAEGSATRLCGGAILMTAAGTTLFDAELHFDHFAADTKRDLWAARPLIPDVRPGAIRVDCGVEQLRMLRDAYRDLHLEPLFGSVRSSQHRGPRLPVSPSPSTALLVLPDYANLFHQFGSVASAYAALMDSEPEWPTANGSLAVYMLSDAQLRPTAAFWSPGLAPLSPVHVRRSPPPPPARFSRVVIAQPATETWWWNVWREERAPSARILGRRRVLASLTRHLSASLLGPPPGTAASGAIGARGDGAGEARGGGPVLLISRPAGTDRRLLNEGELLRGLSRLATERATEPALRLTDARLVEMAGLSTVEQMRLVRGAAALVGAHGAGLLWHLFLPDGAIVVELLNRANRNAYYSNQCAITGRAYAAWQNGDDSAERAPTDAAGRPLADAAPFRNDMSVDAAAVVELVRRTARRSRESARA